MISESVCRPSSRSTRRGVADNSKLSREEIRRTIIRTVLKYLDGEIDLHYLIMMMSVLKNSDIVRSTQDVREVIFSILSLSTYVSIPQVNQNTISAILIELMNKMKHSKK